MNVDKGCLINFNELKEGDILFDSQDGLTTVEYISEKEDYPINCKSIANSKSLCTYTRDGKYMDTDIYPRLFKKDPFKFTFDLSKEARKENNRLKILNEQLWKKNQMLKGLDPNIRQPTKDV